jgi:hypothetical protein
MLAGLDLGACAQGANYQPASCMDTTLLLFGGLQGEGPCASSMESMTAECAPACQGLVNLMTGTMCKDGAISMIDENGEKTR